MKFLLFLLPVILLVACSKAPPVEKEVQRPSEPITGRQAFQMTYPSARIWASDCQPIRIRNLNLENPKSVDGKAGAWEITYVSPEKARARIFTWSAIDVGESLHKGVFGSPEEAWRGPQGQAIPFVPAAIKVDTPEALQTAMAKSHEYLSKPGTKPPVNFLLEYTSRYPDPAWRVFWGPSISAAEWSVFVDASVGQYLGR